MQCKGAVINLSYDTSRSIVKVSPGVRFSRRVYCASRLHRRSEFFTRDPLALFFCFSLRLLLTFTEALLFPFPRFLPAPSAYFAADERNGELGALITRVNDHCDKLWFDFFSHFRYWIFSSICLLSYQIKANCFQRHNAVTAVTKAQKSINKLFLSATAEKPLAFFFLPLW